MVPTRITNPGADQLESLQQRLGAGESLVIQFNGPEHTPELLRELDPLCAAFGERLEVRFYGQISSAFDCRALENIPRVVNLSVDCLQRADNTEILGQLGCLRRLSIGIFELEDNEILRFPNLRSVRQLSVTETKAGAINLSFLSAFTSLESLRIAGQTRGLPALQELPSLETLALAQIGKQTSLAFTNQIANLRELSLLLGGRSSIAEIVASRLQKLDVCRVRGLTELGDLGRFRELTWLSISDQARVAGLSFSAPDSRLEVVRVFNCKSLRQLSGLETLCRLQDLRIGETAMDPEALLALRLPPGIKTCGMYTRRERENKRIREVLDSRGYAEFSHPPES
jgi:hypothetical protein